MAHAVNVLFRLIDSFSAPVSRMQSNLSAFERSADKAHMTLGRIGLGFAGVATAWKVFNKQLEADTAAKGMESLLGLEGAAAEPFYKQIDKLSNRFKLFKGEALDMFSIIGSKQPELLDSAEGLAKVTEATVLLSRAARLGRTETAGYLTTIMNQFKAGAEEAAYYADVLSTAQQKGAGSVAYMAEFMTRSGGTFAAFNHNIEDAALMSQAFAKAGIEASTAGTAAASLLGKLTSQGEEFNPVYTKMADIMRNIVKSDIDFIGLLDLGQREGAKFLAALKQQVDVLDAMEGKLYEAGAAEKAAIKNQSSLAARLEETTAAFFNSMTSVNQNSLALNAVGGLISWVGDNMERLIDILIWGTGFWYGLKFATWAATLATKTNAGVTWAAVLAQKTYAAATWAATLATKTYGPVMWAATLATKTYAAATWLAGAATAFLAAPIYVVAAGVGVLAYAFIRLYRQVSMVFSAFRDGGIVAGMRAIGAAAYEFILAPFRLIAAAIDYVVGFFNKGNGLGLTAAFDSVGDKIAGRPSSDPVAAASQNSAIGASAIENISRSESVKTERHEKNVKIDVDFSNLPAGAQAKINNNNMIGQKSTFAM